MKRILLLFILMTGLIKVRAQSNISHTRISVITVGSADELYSLFGHTAIRIIDSVNHSDIVYNWGGFTYDQPNFYLKFLRGKLLYYSSADRYADFMAEYVYEQRSVYEQELNLDSTSKQNILNAIAYNMQDSNRYYKYDFLLDNCTTRVKDIVLKNIPDAKVTGEIVPASTSSRDMIHYYLDRGGKPWTKLGIDILLGSRLDWKVSNDDAMFLPEFLMKGLNQTQKSGQKLVGNSRVLLDGAFPNNSSSSSIPLIVLTVISLLLYIIARLSSSWAIAFTKFSDALLLYISGLIGILLLFMWFGTDHTVCQNNYNLAWAFPLNLIVAFLMLRKPGWLGNYFFVMAVITGILLAAWFWLPQQLNIALLPVVILLLTRYINFANKYRQKI